MASSNITSPYSTPKKALLTALYYESDRPYAPEIYMDVDISIKDAIRISKDWASLYLLLVFTYNYKDLDFQHIFDKTFKTSYTFKSDKKIVSETEFLLDGVKAKIVRVLHKNKKGNYVLSSESEPSYYEYINNRLRVIRWYKNGIVFRANNMPSIIKKHSHGTEYLFTDEQGRFHNDSFAAHVYVPKTNKKEDVEYSYIIHGKKAGKDDILEGSKKRFGDIIDAFYVMLNMEEVILGDSRYSWKT